MNFLLEDQPPPTGRGKCRGRGGRFSSRAVAVRARGRGGKGRRGGRGFNRGRGQKRKRPETGREVAV